MIVSVKRQTHSDASRKMLKTLGIPTQHVGYRCLCLAIPEYARDKSQAFTKELYPSISRQLNYGTGAAVERSIRYVIEAAWKHRNTKVWNACFPGCADRPSNKVFISTLAEYL